MTEKRAEETKMTLFKVKCWFEDGTSAIYEFEEKEDFDVEGYFLNSENTLGKHVYRIAYRKE